MHFFLLKFIQDHLRSVNYLISSNAGILRYGVKKIPTNHGLSQDLETGCPKLAIVKLLGIQIFKGDHNILKFQP